jgi:hypothetical protein
MFMGTFFRPECGIQGAPQFADIFEGLKNWFGMPCVAVNEKIY